MILYTFHWNPLVFAVACCLFGVQPKPAGEGLTNRAAKPAGAAGASMAKRYMA